MRCSNLANGLQTSPIITLAAEINEKIQRGEKFYNLTIGDFNPKVFPIPEKLKLEIQAAYDASQTNYPGAFGALNLRESVSRFLEGDADLAYTPNDILIASGGRPLIYSAYREVVNPDEPVIFPVPSWNNDYYTHLSSGKAVILETRAENYFMPTAADIKPHLKDAALIALCSPLNPTGTVLSQDGLAEICDLVLEENRARGKDRKPVYVMFDQIYWLLTFGDTRHHTPVNLRPEMRDYTIFIDGVSKAFAGTGVRVGWAYGPSDIIKKMRTMIAHMGAWAPKPEQVAVGNFLADRAAVDGYLDWFRKEIRSRLEGFYKGFIALKQKGHRVDAIEPQAAMYLTVQLNLAGAVTAEGQRLEHNADVHRYILDEAKVGLVPFSHFGASESSNWYRLSVGTCRLQEVEVIISALDAALNKLKFN